MALNIFGWLHAHLGNHRQALASCQEALTVVEEIGDRRGEADTLDSLGYIHHQLGHYQHAVDCYQRAFELFERLGDRYYQADVLTHLGDARLAAGDNTAAADAWRRALAILDELDRPSADQVRAKLDLLTAGVNVTKPRFAEPTPTTAHT
jgi:tetratricopeptide (TPR) repeat protein